VDMLGDAANAPDDRLVATDASFKGLKPDVRQVWATAIGRVTGEQVTATAKGIVAALVRHKMVTLAIAAPTVSGPSYQKKREAVFAV